MTKWKYYFLGELGEITSSKRIFQREYVDSGIPFYRTKEIKELANKELISSELFISRERYEEIKEEFSVPEIGDILITAIGTVGEIYVVEDEKEFYFKDGNILWLKKFKDIDPYFLRYLLSSLINELHNLSSGSAYKALPIAKLKEYKIPLPPIEEQRRIAAILDKADGVRRKRKEAIALTEELLRSAFLEMFGDPVTNPKGWRQIPLGELLAEPLQNGAYFPRERYVEAPDGVEMVHMSDAFYNFVERGSLKRVEVTSEEFEKYQLISNDVLVARRSLNYEGSAKPCLILETDQPLIFESSLIRVRLSDEVIDSFFFFSYMLEPRARSAYVFPNVTKSTISGINQTGLKRISVFIPPISTQKKYREIYEKVLGAQFSYQKDFENIDNLFNSLLQRAFRGEL